MNSLLKTLSGLAAVGAAGIGYASLIERNAFALRRFSMPVLPSGRGRCGCCTSPTCT